MKFEKVIYVVISTVLITAFILISFISTSSNSGTNKGANIKKIYYVDHISHAHEKIIRLFNQKYKDQIEVEAINLTFDKFSTNERKELLARYLRSKSNRIDVFAVDQIWVPRFAKWGIPMEKFITQQQKSALLKYAMQTCSYKDTLIAVPLYIDLAIMFYRKDFLKNLPDFDEIQRKINKSITWEELINLRSRLNNSTNPFFIFPAYDYEGLICIYTEMLASLGVSILENDSLKLNTPEAEKALQLLVDMVNNYNVSPKEVLSFKENPSYDFFIDKAGIFLRGWTSFDIVYKDRFTPEVFKNLGKAPTPHFKNHKSTSVFGGWNLMISKYSSNISEAAVFINFFLSEDAQKIMYEEGGYLPINQNVYYDSLFIKKHPDLSFYRMRLEDGFHRPFSEKYTSISDILSYYIHMAINQKIPVKKALEVAADKINSESIFLK